jgi:hypothetical protein
MNLPKLSYIIVDKFKIYHLGKFLNYPMNTFFLQSFLEMSPTLLLFFLFTFSTLEKITSAQEAKINRTEDYLLEGTRIKKGIFKFQWVRPCVLLTQLVELNFRELLDLTLTKVVIGYITCELYITRFVKNNEFLAIIVSFLTKIANFLTKMTFETRYMTEITIKLII